MHGIMQGCAFLGLNINVVLATGRQTTIKIIMRPSLGGGRILRRTLSVCPSVRPSRYRCHWLRLFGPASVTSRHLANYNDTYVLFGTH